MSAGGAALVPASGPPVQRAEDPESLAFWRFVDQAARAVEDHPDRVRYVALECPRPGALKTGAGA